MWVCPIFRNDLYRSVLDEFRTSGNYVISTDEGHILLYVYICNSIVFDHVRGGDICRKTKIVSYRLVNIIG